MSTRSLRGSSPLSGHFFANLYLAKVAFDRHPQVTLECTERGLRTFPYAATLLVLQARAQTRLGQPRPALQSWCRLLQVAPEYPVAVRECSWLARQMGRGAGCPRVCETLGRESEDAPESEDLPTSGSADPTRSRYREAGALPSLPPRGR